MVTTSLKDNYPSVKNFFVINSPGKGTGIVRYIRCEIFNRSPDTTLLLSPLANFDNYHMFFYPSLLINCKCRYLFSNYDDTEHTPDNILKTIKRHRYCFSNQKLIRNEFQKKILKLFFHYVVDNYVVSRVSQITARKQGKAAYRKLC